jgi:hypothetical protein
MPKNRELADHAGASQDLIRRLKGRQPRKSPRDLLRPGSDLGDVGGPSAWRQAIVQWVPAREGGRS